jgi:hypothetical protein
MSRENDGTSTLIGALRHQKDAVQTRPPIFQTVSEDEFSEVGLPFYGVLGS